jgi:cell division septation protein DedD
MPSFERGVYEPPNDDIRVFDDDEQDLDEEGSRLPLLIVIALLVLAAFGGVVYLAWSQGVERGRADAPRMIVAAPGPVKEAATDNSGTQTHSLKIYDQPAPADDSSDDSASPPPTAAAKPAASPVVIAPPPAALKPATVAPVVPKPEATAPKPAPIVEKPASRPVVVAEKPASKPAPVVTHAAAPETASAPPAPLVTTPKPVAATPKTEATASGGAYELQIGAYKSQDEADAAWKAYKFKHPSAAGYSEDVHKADLGDKGIWYRLRIGPFSDKAAASGACDKLKADGGACLLAK